MSFIWNIKKGRRNELFNKSYTESNEEYYILSIPKFPKEVEESEGDTEIQWVCWSQFDSLIYTDKEGRVQRCKMIMF